MKSAALALLIAVAWAAPAAAQSPTVIRFAPDQKTPVTGGDGVIETPPSCVTGTVASGGWDDGPFLRLTDLGCEPRAVFRFNREQAVVSFFVRGVAGATLDFSFCGPQFCDGEGDVVVTASVVATGEWQPLVLAAPNHELRIASGLLYADGVADIDDVAFARERHPDTAIPVTTASVTSPTPATFTFSSTSTPSTFMCSVDGAPYARCRNPASFEGLAPGTHSLSVYAVDAYGTTDEASPASTTFVVNPPNVVPPPDRDRDGVPDSADNCPDAANSDQADGDADGVGNACDTLPPGNVPPKPGETSVLKVISGEVFVKLPARAALGFSGMHAPFQAGGFIPLKGAASIPLGATVDTRRGEVEVSSAANSYSAADRRAKRQQARIRAALFLLKQKRKAKARSATIPTDVSLLSPPGAEARCAGAPPKGTVVRSISMVVKGLYRTVGGATTSTARSASFNTSDRCDGTLTEVGRGKVSLAVKGRKKPVTVKAGQAYLVKAKLFRAKKGRKP